MTPTASNGKMERRSLVVDANILIKAVLGRRVRQLRETYGDSVVLHLPKSAFDEAGRKMPMLAAKTGVNLNMARDLLASFAGDMELVTVEKEQVQAEARRRMKRDPSDWPIPAVATWTTANVEIYLAG